MTARNRLVLTALCLLTLQCMSIGVRLGPLPFAASCAQPPTTTSVPVPTAAPGPTEASSGDHVRAGTHMIDWISLCFSAAAQVATWITICLVYLTLRERKTQGAQSIKPELIVPNSSLSIYGEHLGQSVVPLRWLRPRTPSGESELPKLTLFNVGLGVALDVVACWQWNSGSVEDTLDSIRKYLYDANAGLIVSEIDERLSMRITSGPTSRWYNVDSLRTLSVKYLLPVSAAPDGMRLPLPGIYTAIVPLVLAVQLLNYERHEAGVEALKSFSFPKLTLRLDYKDLAGAAYRKEIAVATALGLIRLPVTADELAADIVLEATDASEG